jgi:long-chain acyl-CoA synthetase
MNLPLKLAEQSKNFPNKEAIIYNEQRITYGELDASVKKLAHGLSKLGILPGDRVLLALENCPEFVISYYAILRARGIAVPVNPQYTMNELSVIMANALPKTAITTREIAPLLASISEETPLEKGIITIGAPEETGGAISFKKVLDSGSPDFASVKPARNEVAVLMFTAGSTGSTRGAMLTHHNLFSNAEAFAQCCRLTPADRSLLIAPAYHAAAQTCVMNATLVTGATLFIHEGWKGPGPLLESIQNDRITFYFGPPTMYTLLVDHPDTENYNLESWRYALTGAAPTPPDLFKKFQDRFGFQLMEGYGLTETSPVTTMMPLEGTYKIGSIGLPIPGVEVRIVDYEDREVPVNQIGEIVVRGPNVMKGYYNRPEETNWVMRNGWFHTGDLAYMDSSGYLFIVDRKKDLVIRGGLNIYPKEIEEVLYSHPSVFDAAVIGVPDPIMGEEVMAFVLLREGVNVTPEEIREFCSKKLARYKIPKHIRFVENLPKTTTGKLLKKELQKMI